jgi:hypothetical protein
VRWPNKLMCTLGMWINMDKRPKHGSKKAIPDMGIVSLLAR